MKRLLFFAGVYDTLDLFIYELKRELETMQYETMVFDVRDMQQSLKNLAQFVARPVEAAVTFNNLGFNMELHPGVNLWEELNIPCINILMDHPFCYHNALAAAPRNAVVLCTDRNHMAYVSRFYPKIPVSGFLPHGGIEACGVRKPVRERKIDVLYAGGLSRSFAENVIPDLSGYQGFDVKKVCEEAYRMLTEHPERTTEDVLEEVLLAEGVCFCGQELAEIIADLHVVDLYVVSYFREQAVKAVAESGIEITLYGAGWEDCAWIGLPNVRYGGRVAAEEIVEQMKDAKIVLNTMTWFKDGTHDRIFNGMLQGAVVVSDSSVYMKEEFCGKPDADGTDRRELLLFELQEISSLPDQIKALLEDETLAQEIADRGYEKAKAGHTWHNRAAELKQDILDQTELMDVLHRSGIGEYRV